MRKTKGFTIAEILVAGAILVPIFFAIVGASIMLRNVCYTSIAAHELQRGMNIVMNYIIKHGPGETEYNGLRSATAYTIPVTNPAGSEIRFTDTNGVVRRYYLSNNSIIYESPTAAQATQTIYTAPAGSQITLLFVSALPAGNEVVRVYMAVTRNIAGKLVSGDLNTYVDLKNVPN